MYLSPLCRASDKVLSELEHPSIMKYASKAIGSPLTSTFYNTEEHLKLLISIPSDFWHWITCWPMHAYPPAPWHHSEESPHPRWSMTCQPEQLAACHCSTLFHTSPLSPNASVQWDLQLLHYAGTSWSHVWFSMRRARPIQMGPGACFSSEAQWEITNFWVFTWGTWGMYAALPISAGEHATWGCAVMDG